LFWAAAALGDVPALGWGKLVLIAVGVAAVWAAVVVGIAWQAEVARAPLVPENRGAALLVAAVSLGVMWAVPAILYAPLVPLSLPRSMRVAVFQVALRAFAYVLVVAVVMVGLAVAQIWSGADVRAALLP
jgi:hypothetical protein